MNVGFATLHLKRFRGKTTITANGRFMGCVMKQSLFCFRKRNSLNYFCDKYKQVFNMAGVHLSH